jgi:hypothetical protein
MPIEKANGKQAWINSPDVTINIGAHILNPPGYVWIDLEQKEIAKFKRDPNQFAARFCGLTVAQYRDGSGQRARPYVAGSRKAGLPCSKSCGGRIQLEAAE